MFMGVWYGNIRYRNVFILWRTSEHSNIVAVISETKSLRFSGEIGEKIKVELFHFYFLIHS